MNVKVFLRLKSVRQIEYLEEGDFTHLKRNEKIEFLKTLLKEEISSDTAACALSLLKELNYPDRYYFRKFLYHKDDAVADVARKAINKLDRKRSDTITMEDMLREGESDDRILLADYFLAQEGKINEEALIAFLRINDMRVRDLIIKKVTSEQEVDDAVLSETITRGAAWYVRAALVEILGNRKSQHLFDSIDFLMNDRNVEVKLKLIDALAKLGMEKGRVYLQQLTHDAIIWVRKQAHRALQKH